MRVSSGQKPRNAHGRFCARRRMKDLMSYFYYWPVFASPTLMDRARVLHGQNISTGNQGFENKGLRAALVFRRNVVGDADSGRSGLHTIDCTSRWTSRASLAACRRAWRGVLYVAVDLPGLEQLSCDPAHYMAPKTRCGLDLRLRADGSVGLHNDDRDGSARLRFERRSSPLDWQ